MSLTVRILLGFFVLALAAIYLLMNPILDRVERQYLEAAEEPMVDTAEILAAIVSRELEATGALPHSFTSGFDAVDRRVLEATIYNLLKTRVLMDAYITDARGIVIFDSGNPDRVGSDLSGFYDVFLTLQGRYGARSTREDEDDDLSSIMYVGAPLIVNGKISGALSVYKPQRSMREFIQETKNQIMIFGFSGIAVFLLVGVLLSRWVTEPIARLTRHAEAVTRGERPAPPRMPGRHLRVLGESVERMRDALEDRNYVESYVQTLSHEMKAPVAAIRGASELLEENLPDEQKERFIGNIRTEAVRLQSLIEQLLALSSLESRKRLDNPQPVDVAELARRVVAEARSRSPEVVIEFRTDDRCNVRGDEFLLETAISNLVQNAIEFSPLGGRISIAVRNEEDRVLVRVEDEGPGIPDYAMAKLFDRFYSLPRPGTGRKSSGLGLCFVREAAALHGGSASLGNREGGKGAVAILEIPVQAGREVL